MRRGYIFLSMYLSFRSSNLCLLSALEIESTSSPSPIIYRFGGLSFRSLIRSSVSDASWAKWISLMKNRLISSLAEFRWICLVRNCKIVYPPYIKSYVSHSTLARVTTIIAIIASGPIVSQMLDFLVSASFMVRSCRSFHWSITLS